MRAAPLLAVLALAGCLAPAAVLDAPAWAASEARLTPEGASASEVSVAAWGERVVAAANSQGGFGVYRSEDGGRTWAASRFEASAVAPPVQGATRFRGLSDPCVVFGPDGTAYLAGLAVLPTSGVFVARSEDGGATWRDVVLVDEGDPATDFNDKEWLGVSPVTGTLVLAWQKELVVDQMRGVEAALGHRADLDEGHIVVSRSADGGRTWSEPARVSVGAHNNGTQVAFTPTGRGVVLFVDYEASALVAVLSDDDGRTWGQPRAVAPITIAPAFERFGRMHTLPGLAVGPAGELVAVWHDARSGEPDVYAASSLDGGETWGPATRVNVETAGPQLYPWVAVGDDGRVHVSFYDASGAPEAPRFRYALATAPDAASLAFAPARAVSGEDFAPFADGTRGERSLGDYTGLAAVPGGLVAAWADARGERDQVYAARVETTG